MSQPAENCVEKEDAWDKHLWKRRFDVMYKARVSILYHLKRERFFDGWDKAISMATAVTATAAVGALFKQKAGADAELYLAAGTAALSLLPLVVNPAQKARVHANAASDFRRLLADCERAGETWSEDECNKQGARIVEIEAAEPAPLCALVIDCQNQLAGAMGRSNERLRLRLHERLFKQYWDFVSTTIRERSEHESGRTVWKSTESTSGRPD
jgi:hypothetical protein